MTDEKANAERRDLWIPGLFILFFVGLACLQIWFVMLAQSSFSGLVTDQPYPLPDRQAVSTEGTRAGTQPNWTVTVSQEGAGPLEMNLRLTVRNPDGRIIVPDQVTASAERATKFPQMLPLSFAPGGNGDQVASSLLPLAGAWSIRVVVVKGNDRLETVHRVKVTP
jgi:nitrogen fixation protein FixH